MGTSTLRNLAPADLKKDANGFDLPIALGLLVASGQVAFDRPGNYAIVGELALTGEERTGPSTFWNLGKVDGPQRTQRIPLVSLTPHQRCLRA